MAFIIGFGIIVLRRTRPDLPRPFHAAGAVPAAVVGGGDFVLMLGPWATWAIDNLDGGRRGVLFHVGYRHSRLKERRARAVDAVRAT
jgi:hypothetical protein